MINLIKLLTWLKKRRYRKLRKLYIECYPDKYERAMALLAEGATLLDTIRFGQGYILSGIDLNIDNEAEIHITEYDRDEIMQGDENG